MELSVFLGLGLTLLSGTMMTCAIVPMKFARRWKWENIWLLYIGFGQVVFPLLLIRLTAPECLGGVRIRQAIGPGCCRAVRTWLGYRQCAFGHWLHHARGWLGVNHHPGADGFVGIADSPCGAVPAAASESSSGSALLRCC